MKTLVLISFFLLPVLAGAQHSALSLFDNLVSKTWKAEGTWGDGSAFKQELTMNYVMDSTLVVVNSIGFTDREQTRMGLRNHGIRQFHPETNRIKFWEFDVFGGLTEGTVVADGKNIIYQYQYGNSLVTDMWEYVDDATYNFKVGSYENGEWKQLYLSTQFVAVE